jgi:hypothetical protein
MLNPTPGVLRPRALIVDDALAELDTAIGRAAESLAVALEARNVDVDRRFRRVAARGAAELEPRRRPRIDARASD